MGVTRKVLKPGNEAEKPMKGDEIIVEYTGNLYDETKGPSNDFRGKEFDSSKGRGDFKILIGMGKVIKGWDEEILQMSLGEICILTITG
ncbi:hypothetical protein MMC18_008812 [Xylographa bjoerkii]|nr:hypothetical protein [Xylographa opegraphella]MCJ1395926.1 hypothetical protein [Xylographa bjoerkii]